MREFILKIESEGFVHFDHFVWVKVTGGGLHTWQYDCGEWKFDAGKWEEILPEGK